MIYLNHDFYKNMVAGVKSGDIVFITSLFVNELSDLVVFDTDKLISVLNKTGVKATSKDAAETIVDKTLAALPKNVQLQKGIAFLFTEINGLINNNKGNKQTWKQTIDDIAKGINLVANKLGQPGTFAASVKSDIMQQIVTKAETKGSFDGEITAKKSSGITVKKVLFVLGAGTLIFLAIRYIRKNMISDAAGSTVPALAAGGALPPVATPLPIQSVIAQQPIVPPPAVQQPLPIQPQA